MDLLANAYNKSHKAQVQVTIIPAANYVQKFGTAAAGGSGPDVASIDLVYLPYFASTGVLEDITDDASKLPYAGEAHGLAAARVSLGFCQGQAGFRTRYALRNPRTIRRASLLRGRPTPNACNMFGFRVGHLVSVQTQSNAAVLAVVTSRLCLLSYSDFAYQHSQSACRTTRAM